MARRPRNVLAVANWASDVGYAWWLMERFWVQIAEECRRVGTRCAVAYPQISTIPTTVEASPLEPVEWNIFDDSPEGRARTAELLRRHSIGSVYLTDRLFRDPFYAFLRAQGVGVIVNHDHTPGDRPRSGGLRGAARALMNRLPRVTCDLWVAISPLMRDRALQADRVPPNRCVVVQNGIDRTSPGPEARSRMRRELGAGPDDVIVVSVGRANRYKGLDFSIRLAARAIEGGAEQVRFVHVGGGPHLQELRAEAEAAGLPPDRYRFLGRKDNVPELLQAADVAFHPSKGEGFSLAILEYMRAGLPVLVPDRPSVCQAVQHEESGLVYRREDLESATANLRRLLEPRVREMLGRRGREEMLNRYSWDRTAGDFAPVAEYLAGAAERPRPGGG